MQIKVYINPFDDNGNYTEFIDVTNYVELSKISTITKSIDSTEYDTGVFKFSSFSLKLDNQSGIFSDVGVTQSMFKYKRSDSKIKIAYIANEEIVEMSSMLVGEDIMQVEELIIFEGLINDEATKTQIGELGVDFKCFGYEYLFQRETVNIADLNIGDSIDDIIYTILNKSSITAYLDVQIANINTSSNQVVDSIDDLENKTVKETLDELLLISNSVLYIKDNVVYVSNRTPSALVKKTFYGQASNNGIENIVDIKNYRNGLNRLFNYVTWADVNNVKLNSTSINKFGARKKELSSTLITNSTKIDNILTNILSEFGTIKTEMDLIVTSDFDVFALRMLDKISIDYPTVFYVNDGDVLPVYGVAVYGETKYPFGEWTLQINSSDTFKIIGIQYNLINNTTTLKIRGSNGE